jgi:hypothetical protein
MPGIIEKRLQHDLYFKVFTRLKQDDLRLKEVCQQLSTITKLAIIIG